MIPKAQYSLMIIFFHGDFVAGFKENLLQDDLIVCPGSCPNNRFKICFHEFIAGIRDLCRGWDALYC